MSGPFQTPGAPLSTMGVFRTSEAAEEFAAGAPYMLNGLAQGWEIRLWHEMVPEPRPASPGAHLPLKHVLSFTTSYGSLDETAHQEPDRIRYHIARTQEFHAGQPAHGRSVPGRRGAAGHHAYPHLAYGRRNLRGWRPVRSQRRGEVAPSRVDRHRGSSGRRHKAFSLNHVARRRGAGAARGHQSCSKRSTDAEIHEQTTRPCTDIAKHSTPILADMTIQQMDNVGIVVEDLEAAVAFFAELGMELEGKMPVAGPWVDRIVGLDDVRVDIAMMRTPHRHSRLELMQFRAPRAVSAEPQNAPANTLGIRRIMFAVDDIEDVLARLRTHGAELATVGVGRAGWTTERARCPARAGRYRRRARQPNGMNRAKPSSSLSG